MAIVFRSKVSDAIVPLPLRRSVLSLPLRVSSPFPPPFLPFSMGRSSHSPPQLAGHPPPHPKGKDPHNTHTHRERRSKDGVDDGAVRDAVEETRARSRRTRGGTGRGEEVGWRMEDPTRNVRARRNGRNVDAYTWIRHHTRQAQNTQRIERQVQSHRHGKIRACQVRTPTLGLRQIQQTETKPTTTSRGPQSMGQSDETARTSMKPPPAAASEMEPTRKEIDIQDDVVDANRRMGRDQTHTHTRRMM